MKTKLLSIAILIAGMTLFATSCEKKEPKNPKDKDKETEEPTIKNDLTLSGKIESSVSLEGHTIKAIVEGEKEGEDETLGSSVVKKDGSFSLKLKTPTLLYKLDSEEGVSSSNKDIKVATIPQLSIKGEKEGLVGIGLFNKTTNEFTEAAIFVYADGNTTLKGTKIESGEDKTTHIYDADIQKGWNIMKVKRTGETVTYTTIPSIPTTYRWVYESDSK